MNVQILSRLLWTGVAKVALRAFALALLPTLVWAQSSASYAIPEFEDQVWIPPTTQQQWVPPATIQIWIDATTIQVWIPPTTIQVWVPPTTIQVWIPPVTQQQWVPPVTQVIYHPPVTETIHHDIEIGVRHIDAVTHIEHHDAETRTEHVEGYWSLNYTSEYWDWEEIWGGYWTWVPSEYSSSEGEYVWVDEVYYDWVYHGPEEYWEWTEGYDITIVEREPWDEVVVDVEEHDEYYLISPAWNEVIVIQDGYYETVTIEEGHWITVTVSEGRWETQIVPGYFRNEDVPGHYETQEVPGHWDTQTVPGHWITVEIPGRWSIVLIPASNLSVSNDGINITGISWSTGRSVGVPDFVTDMLNNPNWIMPEPIEGDVTEITSSDFTPELAFGYFGTMEEEMKKTQPKRLRKKPTGGWDIPVEVVNRPLTVEEIVANIKVIILIHAAEMTRVSTRRADICAYITYEKMAVDTTAPRKVYTGRTAGWGDLLRVLLDRDRNHHKNGAFLPAIPNSVIITKGLSHPAYMATRGREQQVIDYHDYNEQLPNSYSWSRSHAENARPTPTRAHGTPGVSAFNVHARDYWQMSCDALGGQVWEFTGANTVQLTDEYYEFSPWPFRAELLPLPLNPFWRSPLPYSP